jgi:hypothetical protein
MPLPQILARLRPVAIRPDAVALYNELQRVLTEATGTPPTLTTAEWQAVRSRARVDGRVTDDEVVLLRALRSLAVGAPSQMRQDTFLTTRDVVSGIDQFITYRDGLRRS